MLFFSPELLLLSLWLGFALDYWLGEPKRWHPLIGFGRVVNWLEQCCNTSSTSSTPLRQRLSGLFAWSLLVLPLPCLLYSALQYSVEIRVINAEHIDTKHPDALWWIWLSINLFALWFAVGAKSLTQHLQQVMQPLEAGDLASARIKVGWIVSRDTADMDEHRITRAAIESGLENGSDAIYAPLFWFLVGGAPLVLLYRLANTLDAMWGYKTERYRYFGWASARLDDLLNWLPARLCALSYAFSGAFTHALSCWYHQGKTWESPNAGPVMAAGAGALQVQLGGGDHYHGHWKSRPALGCGHRPSPSDLQRTLRLLNKALSLWLVGCSLLLGGLIRYLETDLLLWHLTSALAS